MCCNGVRMHYGSNFASALTISCTRKKDAIVAPSLSRIWVHISQPQYPELLGICPKLGCNYFGRELYLHLLLLLRPQKRSLLRPQNPGSRILDPGPLAWVPWPSPGPCPAQRARHTCMGLEVKPGSTSLAWVYPGTTRQAPER